MRLSPSLAHSLFVGVLSLLAGGASAEAATVPIRVNCAGPDYYTPGSIHYSADHSYIGGVTGQNQSISDIQNTQDDTLYKTERFSAEELGSFQYEFPVANGSYVVLLHFAEIWFGAPGGPSNSNLPGKRVFSVDIEGQRRLSRYDIIADVGTMTAAVKRYDVTVCDGGLSLSFTASVNKPKCSAIEILPAPTPYSGVGQLPGRVEAEHFDKGGEGSAFHDGWSYNQGNVFRTSEGVDIRTVSNTGGGYGVGWTEAGEWLGYTVNVTRAGTYTLQARVASAVPGGTFHLEFNGVDKTGPISIPNTGGWDTWQTVTVHDVQLSAGHQWMRLVMDTHGENGHVGDIDFIDFSSSTPAPSAPRLRWAPPPLTSPEIIKLDTGSFYCQLDNTKDYIIEFPKEKKAGKTHLVGGHNIVIIGGHQSIPDDNAAGALFLQEQKGTVHIEGLLIDNSGLVQKDAIALAAQDAIVQVQNVRVDGLVGRAGDAGVHSDVLQPWGGVKELRIHRLTGSSNYQGLFFKEDFGTIGSISIQNTNLTYQPVASWPNEGGYLLWFNELTGSDGSKRCWDKPVALSEVYVTPKPNSSLGKSVWPDVDVDVEPPMCLAQVNNNQASWPGQPSITGVVKLGPPPGGDFVPAGVAGLNYVSPGYEQP